MKKVSTVATKQSGNISRQQLTIGLDLGDRNSCYCLLDEGGEDRTGDFRRLQVFLIRIDPTSLRSPLSIASTNVRPVLASSFELPTQSAVNSQTRSCSGTHCETCPGDRTSCSAQ